VFLFSRLYNKDWRDKKMPMSAFERYVSEVVEQESREEVEERFSSSHGGFAALQILQRFPSDYWNLDLLLLESTNKAPSGIVAHRRLGGAYPSTHQPRSKFEASPKDQGIETVATKSAWRKSSPAFQCNPSS
jgi:hypothetical protein